MADPVNGLLAARMDPERRRRIGNALMAHQYDRETPQDAPVTDRAGLFPLAIYANGQTGPAWPGLIATPVEKMAQVLRGEITPGTPEFNEAGFDIAGAAMVGGLAAARPRGSLGMSGRPTEPHPWPPPKPSPFPHGVKREWSPGGETVEIYTAETKPYPMGGHGRMPRSFSDEPLAENKLKLKPRSDGSGEWVWPFTEAEEALVRSYGARGAPDLYANARPGAALGAGLSGASERQGIRAYHGSPHDFDKFDMSKIGTGEGAQAYGHGLYFAENEGVARGYKDRLTTVKNMPIMGQRHFVGDAVVKALDRHGGNRAAAIAELEKGLEVIPATNPRRQSMETLLADLKAGKDEAGLPAYHEGKMYEVNIKANPDDFLDWDKVVTPQVADRLADAFSGRMGSHYDELADLLRGAPDQGMTGQEAMQWVGNTLEKGYVPDGVFRDITSGKAAANASEYLRESGIPGIKYLDQGSRGAGEGSRNYVVFDANLIEILRKYGLLGMLGAGGMAQELLKPSKPNIPDDAA